MTDPLFVTADLDIEVDGVPAHVSGDGTHLRVTSPTPARFVRASLRSRPPGVGVGLLGRLRSTGLSVSVDGPRGTFVQVGDGPVRVGGVPLRLVGLGGLVLVGAVIVRLLRR